MRQVVAIILLVSAFAELQGCTGIHTSTVVRPILNLEVVRIPTQGKIVTIEGEAELLKRERSSGYLRVEIGTIVDENDILWMQPGCIVKIGFGDGSFILNEKQEKEVFITFKLDAYKAVPKISGYPLN